MTPLSIAHPMQSKKRKGKTFEEQIKERSLVPTGKPKFSFNENYREMVTSKGKKPNTTSWKQKDHIPDSSSLPLIKEPTLNSRTNENKKLHSTPPSDLKAIELKTFSACTEPLAETGKNSPSFSVPSLPKLMITPHTISAKVLGSSTNFTSRTASSFASACPNITEISANSKQTSLFNRSTISPEDIQKLNTIPKVYRDCSQASDADDERSDIESQIQDNDSRSEVREPFSKQEQDDTGLPSMMEMVSFGKKRRASHDDDDDDDENNDERSAGDSSASNAIMNFVTPPENGEMERESLDSTKHGTSHESGKVVEDELIAKPGQAKSSQHQCAKRVKI